MYRLFLFSFLLNTTTLWCQSAIFLNNPSFEDEPSVAKPPFGWYYCGQPGESPPDVHPGGFFGVDRLAKDGATFVGMVVRDNGTNEGIGQKLPSPLMAGKCYSFSLYAARSETYQSISRVTFGPANFSQAVALYIWGGYANCEKKELLAKSPSIVFEGWKNYSFSLQPREDYTHLSIEAYFAVPGRPYNGNVLLDQASALLIEDCEQKTDSQLSTEVVESPSIQSEQNLREYIIEQGQQARFADDGITLEQHVFIDKDGRLFQANKYLWKIERAIRQFPGLGLLIIVDGTSDYLRQSHLRQFAKALKEAGFKESQYQLRLRKRSDQKRQWLWSLQEKEFWMQLIK